MIFIAPEISPDSWLNEPRFREFVKAYQYASLQTKAIPGMAKLTPEELYFVFEALEHGLKFHSEKSNAPK